MSSHSALLPSGLPSLPPQRPSPSSTMSKPGPEARLLRAALDFVLRRKRDPLLPPKPPSEWWLSTKPYRKPFVYTFLLAGLGTTDFVVTGFNTRALELSRRKIFIMEQFLERLEKEKLFASGGGGGGEGHEEEGSLSRTEVNLALYGLGLDEIEGGEDEVAAEAGMIEEERRRKERRVVLERERRRKEGQSKEEETKVSFSLFWIGSFLVVFAPFVARSLTRMALTGALNSLVNLHFAFFFSIRFKRKPWRIESSNVRPLLPFLSPSPPPLPSP